jgi:organic radical activating enzyme
LRYASTDGSEKQPYGSMIKCKKQLGVAEWKYLVKSFPRKLREVQLTGGEPLIVPFYSELVNWLLDEGYFVTVFSSLWNLSGLDVEMSTERFLRYRISATYHRKMEVEKFKEHLKKYRAKYRVDVEEIETDEIKGSFIKSECRPEYGHTCVGFMYAPDGRIYHNFYELIEEYAKK